ncbi:uncharacterized protein LOC108238585 [Kryptolebias marmoratus]|uniref:uncharacterized protein LOC108238585 n=1 Tax=Kryptolebias marmoratus TaxID=37003 RepID=UPI000D5303E6|nr:uncharacterized protein LOC108238585 [Kryptolebias marmoratus]
MRTNLFARGVLRTKQNNKMASTTTFVWTDDEVELLLRVTLNYKTAREKDGVDWESCQSKYADIMDAFQAQYPARSMAGGKDFPHQIRNISKAQVTSKIKSIRGKYRQALNTGRRNGQGRVILLFFGLCEEIWGRSPAATPISAGFETGDLAESSSSSSTRAASPAAEPPAGLKSEECEVNLDSHRTERETPKRKLPADMDDLQIKRRMLQIMERSERRNAENLRQINTNIANSTQMIQESLSLMRELIQQRVKQIELKLL